MTELPRLAVRGLHKHFTLHLRGGVVRQVLSDISFAVQGGECLALVGPSGLGKSTLLKCLSGHYGIDAGQALWRNAGAGLAELDLARASPRQWRALRRREIGYVSQFLRALPRVSAIDLVAERVIDALQSDTPAGASVDGELDGDSPHARQARERAAELLARLRLPRALWGLPPATFSGGEQQRVNIARALAVPCGLLLLDEPTASLDADNRRVVVDLIREVVQQGAAVVGIFHDEEVRDAVSTQRVALGSL
jgi:alpha-D-ribose 1-methylphosphonate 5-triphosphate synthase subunit PhnL